MIWLGKKRGYLSDWVTQQWVRANGRRISLLDHDWLNSAVGDTRLIGKDFFKRYAESAGLEILQGGRRGLIKDFSDLSRDSTDFGLVSVAVRDFYERTSEYELDAWSEWHGLFRPFGQALASLFSRRLQQLNIPLSSLDLGRGMSSTIVQLWDPQSGRVTQAGWIRELHATQNVAS